MARELFRRKILRSEQEVTPGTAPGSPTAKLIQNGEAQLDAQQLERELDRSYLGAHPFVNVARVLRLNGDIDLLGAATAGTAAPHSDLLQAAGMSETLDAGPPAETTYAPVSTGFKTVAGDFFYGDDQFPFTYGILNMQITAEIHNYLRARIELLAAQGDPANTAIPTGDFSAFQDPVPIETEVYQVTIGGTDFDAVMVSMDLGNQLQLAEGSEERAFAIRDRRTTGRIRLYDPGVGTKDFYADAKAGTNLTLSWNVTGVAGKIVTVACPKIQLGYPQKVDIDGLRGLEFDYRALPDTGNDEFSIVFS